MNFTQMETLLSWNLTETIILIPPGSMNKSRCILDAITIKDFCSKTRTVHWLHRIGKEKLSEINLWLPQIKKVLLSADSLWPSCNRQAGTSKSIILTPKNRLGVKTRAANFSASITATLNNFAKTLIFLATGKELPSENATAILSLDHAKSLSTIPTLSALIKTMNSKIWI